MNRTRSMTFALAMLASAGLSAFELGKPCTIYFGRKSWSSAQELSETLEQIYGEKFPVKPADKMNTGIFVGVKKADKMVCSSVKGDRLDIYGTNIKYAVADFLERECGVRYLWPGKLGTVIPDGRRAAEEAKAALQEGRVLLRPSGTENLVRIMVEHPEESVAASTAEALRQIVLKYA